MDHSQKPRHSISLIVFHALAIGSLLIGSVATVPVRAAAPAAASHSSDLLNSVRNAPDTQNSASAPAFEPAAQTPYPIPLEDTSSQSLDVIAATASPPITDPAEPSIETSSWSPPISITLQTANGALRLEAPRSVQPGAGLIILWTGEAELASRQPEIVLSAPEGFTFLSDEETASFDVSTRQLVLPIKSAEGELRWKIDPNVFGPFTFQAQVVLEGTVIAEGELVLEDEGLTRLDLKGGEASGLDGALRVDFPAGAAEEALNVRVRRPLDSALPTHLPGGEPFEILAYGQTSKQEIHQFKAPLTIKLSYDEKKLRGDENSLTLKYYNEEKQAWLTVPGKVDTENNILTAWSDHLTVFDISYADWEASRLPSLEPFQIAPFTGAATYDLSLWTPPGPGGLQPSLTLSYNSQEVDNSVALSSQSSWVGMGWSLDTGYDAYGRTITQTVPIDVAAGSGRRSVPAGTAVTRTAYDPLGRTSVITLTDGTRTVYAYETLTTTVTDALTHATKTVADVWGRTAQVVPATGPGVSYSYDTRDRLVQALRGGATTALTYDHNSRKLSMSDPDMGSWSYTYDAMGNLKTQTDARGCVTNLSYDLLNRLLGKSYSGTCSSTAPVSYGYDKGANAIGHRTAMTDTVSVTNWGYDERGQTVAVTQTITVTPGVTNTFKTEWGYNSAGLQSWIVYPADNAGTLGEQVYSVYNPQMSVQALGNIQLAANYVYSTQYDAAGRVRLRQLGRTTQDLPILQTQFAYNAWTSQGGRLQSIQAGIIANPISLLNLSYSYDTVGNILSIQDAIVGSPQTQSFAYDALYRLTSAAAANGSQGDYGPEAYTYDASTGNLASKAGVNYTYGAQSSGCPNGALSKAHAVVTAGSNTFCYDQNGNMVRRNVGGSTFNLTFDAENRLTQVTGAASAAFSYNGDGERVLGTENGITTVYIGNYFEWNVNTSAMTKYYYAGSERVAMKVGTNYPTWLLGDHLGSTSVAANNNGSLLARQGYKAWGEQRFPSGASPLPTTFRYTGQREASSIGLYYYGARWYDAGLNRWISSDSVIPGNETYFSPLVVDYHEKQLLERLNTENSNIQDDKKSSLSNLPVSSIAFDRYSYSNNNPLSYKDPDGHFAFLIPLLAGAVIGGAVSTAIYAATAQVTGQEITFAGAAGAFAGGAITGAVSVIATPLAGTLLHAVGIAATGTALVAGTAAVNAAGGAASYLAGGFTQNVVDSGIGNTPSFQPTVGGAVANAAFAGVISPLVGNSLPVSPNTMRTLCQASYFMPGRTIPTLFATQNARHIYAQTLVATSSGYITGVGYSKWEQP